MLQHQNMMRKFKAAVAHPVSAACPRRRSSKAAIVSARYGGSPMQQGGSGTGGVNPQGKLSMHIVSTTPFPALLMWISRFHRSLIIAGAWRSQLESSQQQQQQQRNGGMSLSNDPRVGGVQQLVLGGKGGEERTQVRFCLKYKTSYGQSVKVIGSHPQLGECMG